VKRPLVIGLIVAAGAGLAWALRGGASGSSASATFNKERMATPNDVSIAPTVAITTVQDSYVAAWRYNGVAQTLTNVMAGGYPPNIVNVSVTPGFLIKAVGRYATKSPGVMLSLSGPLRGAWSPVIRRKRLGPSHGPVQLSFTMPEDIGYPNSSLPELWPAKFHPRTSRRKKTAATASCGAP
jgi:hypothetical protein